MDISMLLSVPVIPDIELSGYLGVRLGPSLKDHVERPLRRPTKPRKPRSQASRYPAPPCTPPMC